MGYVKPGEKLGAVSTFGIGALAGVVTVYVTMPLDTVKTRCVWTLPANYYLLEDVQVDGIAVLTDWVMQDAID